MGNTTLEADMLDALRQTAMVVSIHVGVWSGESGDRKAMQDLKDQHGATGNVGRVIKNVMAGADDRLKKAKSAYAAIRAAHVQLTLPWTAHHDTERLRGPRLLPNVLFMDYANAVGRTKREAELALDTMLAHYDDDRDAARANLGSLAATDYPTEAEIRTMFYVRTDFDTIPDDAHFRGLPTGYIDKLQASQRRRQSEMIGGASRFMWSEIRRRVEHLAERTSSTEHRFKTATIEDVRELSTLVPAWNLDGSAFATDIANDIAAMLHGQTFKDVTGSGRETIHRLSNSIIAKLDAAGV